MKIICIVIFYLLSIFYFSSSIHLECSYSTWTYETIGNIYFCSIRNDLNILSIESAYISHVFGDMSSSKSSDQVLGISERYNQINFFPRNLNNIFKRLKMIEFKNCELLEIHQHDLMHLTKLEYLDLENNKIEIIEDGLFDYNPSMRFISFGNNKIFEVHPDVFDHLIKLKYLYMERNECINMNARDSQNGVKSVINQIKTNCPSPGNLNSGQLSPKNDARLTRMSLKIDVFESDLRSCQNSVLGLTREHSSLEKSSQVLNAESLRKLENVETMLDAKIAENSRRIQNVDVRSFKIEKSLQDLSMDSIQEKTSNLEKNVKSFEIFKAETLEKIKTLEKSVKNAEEELKSFRSEIFSALQEILKKVEASSENIERKSTEKIDYMSKNLRSSQTQELVDVNDKINNLKSDLNALRNVFSKVHQEHDAACDAEQDDGKVDE